MPDIRDLLKRSHNGPEIISAHSRINLTEILSSPVALVFDNLFRRVKTSLVVVGRKQNLLIFSTIF